MASSRDWVLFAQLVEQLSDLPAGEFLDGAVLLIERSSELLNASDALLSFGVRQGGVDVADPLHGWRPAAATHRFGPHRESDEAILKRFYALPENQSLDPTTVRLARTSGAARAFCHGEILDGRAWRHHPVSELFDACGIGDRLSGSCPVNKDVEFLLVAYRRRGQRPFGERERDALRALMAAVKPFARRLALSHGYLKGGRPLTPREREVLRHLLQGLSEKEIASEMGLRERSLHHHVTALYRKLGVRSRPELMARFLNGAT